MSTDPSSTTPPSTYPPLTNGQHTSPSNTHTTTPPQPFQKGQRFHSLQAFKDHVRSIAFSQHWEPSVANSNKSKVQMKCRSKEDCPFKIWCRIDQKTKIAVISNVDNSHTCLGAPLADRNQGSRLKFLEQEIPRLLDVRNNRPSGQQVVDAIRAAHGFEISIRQAQRALRSLRLGDMERSYTGLDGQDDSIVGDETLDQDMSMDHELSQLQQPPPHTHTQHQYPPPPLAPQVLHHHQPPQPSPQVQPMQDPHAHTHTLPHGQHPMEMPQRRGWILQTPTGKTITGSSHELIMYLQGAMESSFA